MPVSSWLCPSWFTGVVELCGGSERGRMRECYGLRWGLRLTLSTGQVFFFWPIYFQLLVNLELVLFFLLCTETYVER